MPVRPRRFQAQAVSFSPVDYAGFWRRLLVALVDLAAVAILGVLVTALIVVGTPADLPGNVVLLTGWGALIFGYFVLLKGSRVRTLGYRLGRVRLVDIKGRPPGLGALTVRLLFSVAGPINFLIDLAWIPSDPHHQSLRDKVTRTYVVRAQAQPTIPALIVYHQYHLLGMSLLLQEIEPVDPGVVVIQRRAAL